MSTSTPAKSSTRIVPEFSAERAAETLTNIADESPNTAGESPTNAAGESHTNTTIEYPTYIPSKYLTIAPGGRIPREPLEFSPGVQGTFTYPVEDRLAELREALGQERWAHQRKNITKAIKMYEDGELPLPGWQKIWFANGEVIDGLPDTLSKGVYLWSEVCFFSILYSFLVLIQYLGH
jgi:hypothetical protein